METIYDRIRKLRTSEGMSQQTLALKCGYNDRSSITRIEAGEIDLPQSKILLFASALNTTVGYLMDGDQETVTGKRKALMDACAGVSDDDIDIAIRMIRALKGNK